MCGGCGVLAASFWALKNAPHFFKFIFEGWIAARLTRRRGDRIQGSFPFGYAQGQVDDYSSNTVFAEDDGLRLKLSDLAGQDQGDVVGLFVGADPGVEG
jgi:hypothetical protein